MRELGLTSEAGIADQLGLYFEGFLIPDRGVPASVEATKALWGRLETKIRSGGALGGEQPLRAAQRYQAR